MLISLIIFSLCYSKSRNQHKYAFACSVIFISQILFFTPDLLSLIRPDSINLLFATAIVILFLIGQKIIYSETSKYSLLRVLHNPELNVNSLYSAKTLHGIQCLDQDLRDYPGSYFHITGPIGEFFSIFKEEIGTFPVAMLGLGTGTLACYIKPGQKLDIYEIDEKVIDIAKDTRYFTYLSNCRGKYNIIVGNALYTLNNSPNHLYQVMVVDVYNGAKIPDNLMNAEAIKMYLEKTTENGFLLIHISNRAVDFTQHMKNVMSELNQTAFINLDDDDSHFLKNHTAWILVTKSQESVKRIQDNLHWNKL